MNKNLEFIGIDIINEIKQYIINDSLIYELHSDFYNDVTLVTIYYEYNKIHMNVLYIVDDWSIDLSWSLKTFVNKMSYEELYKAYCMCYNNF